MGGSLAWWMWAALTQAQPWQFSKHLCPNAMSEETCVAEADERDKALCALALPQLCLAVLRHDQASLLCSRLFMLHCRWLAHLAGSPGCALIRVRLPDGVNASRAFGPEATVGTVFDWVDSLDSTTFWRYNLVSERVSRCYCAGTSYRACSAVGIAASLLPAGGSPGVNVTLRQQHHVGLFAPTAVCVCAPRSATTLATCLTRQGRTCPPGSALPASHLRQPCLCSPLRSEAASEQC
jgi:hypothetical protein